MTVINIQGSSLDEIWGVYDSPPTGSSSSAKKRKSKRNNCKVWRLDDIVDTYNSQSPYELYERPKYSRTQFPLHETDGGDEPREEPEKEVHVEPSTHSIKEHYTELLNESKKEKLYIDLSLYVFSGVVLIFILEQFINIGMMLK
jgi:hypothetical protein